MKNIFLTFLIFVLYTGCSEDEQTNQETTIYGTWQIIENYNVIERWTPVSNGYSITIQSNSRYTTTNRLVGCPTENDVFHGSYQIYSSDGLDVLDITIQCSAQDNDAINPKYNFEIIDGFLHLEPTADISTCFELCTEKFKKISNEEIVTD